MKKERLLFLFHSGLVGSYSAERVNGKRLQEVMEAAQRRGGGKDVGEPASGASHPSGRRRREKARTPFGCF
ncbi:hypothetical protein MPTK2_4g05040 [Marchantia polymorpha subsp. ruderalis]